MVNGNSVNNNPVDNDLANSNPVNSNSANSMLGLEAHEEMLRGLRSIDLEKRRLAIRDLAVSDNKNKISILERVLPEETDIQLKCVLPVKYFFLV